VAAGGAAAEDAVVPGLGEHDGLANGVQKGDAFLFLGRDRAQVGTAAVAFFTSPKLRSFVRSGAASPRSVVFLDVIVRWQIVTAN
jgi:hypothetical protein